MNRVYVVIVMWNGWQDTIECLESLLRSKYDDFFVVLCDNGSTDNSLQLISEWAAGSSDDVKFAIKKHVGYANIPIPKPVEVDYYCDSDIGNSDYFKPVRNKLSVIKCNYNMGFASGANVGIRFALSDNECKFIWLLNNDTVVTETALNNLVLTASADKSIGQCGSTLLYYDRPNLVQALGSARYFPYLGLAWPAGWLRKFKSNNSRMRRINNKYNYIIGASLLVSRRFVETVGFMSEDYFLYCEELDWRIRSLSQFNLACATDSLVYHKVGGSIGTSSIPGKKSIRCEFWSVRNRLFLSRRYFPNVLPIVTIFIYGTVALHALCGRLNRSLMIVNIIKNYYLPVRCLLRLEKFWAIRGS